MDHSPTDAKGRYDHALSVMDEAADREMPPAAGHNNPPAPTPFEISRDEIEPLFAEAKNWADGTPVETQEQADSIGRLVDWLRQAGKRADERRKAENKPFDDGKAAVQALYNPLIQPKNGKVDLAIDACKKALGPFIARKEAEQRAIAEKARQEAEAKRIEAEATLRASQADDLAAREEAEAKLRAAKAADKAATKAENAKVGVAGGSRLMTARTRYVPTLVDRRAAARFFWENCPEQFDGLLVRIAEDYIVAGRRELPGFTITETTVVQ